jgi:hypothetical protein
MAEKKGAAVSLYMDDDLAQETLTEEEFARWAEETWTNKFNAAFLADIMQLNGAGVRAGDVLNAMRLLGLRLAGDARDGDEGATQAAHDALVEAENCPKCGGVRVRMKDTDHPGAGWWHRADRGSGYVRRCRARQQGDGS